MSQNNGNLEKDIEKFVKFLIYKFCQIVVQSRLGTKLETSCVPAASSNGWFNLSIQEHPDVQAETKKALNIQQNESIFSRLPISIEISLKTVDGDSLVLEVWSLDQTKIPEKDSLQTKTAQSIYNRMTVLLKSLITLTRTTPAYKLSRRQSPDSYGIYYRIYVAPPQVHALGDGYKTVRIGQIETLQGRLGVTVAYRTKMTISPTKVEIPNNIMVKSDHFNAKDASPKRNLNSTPVIDINKPMRNGAFVDPSKIKQFSEKDYILPEESPFSWIIKKKDGDGGIDFSVLTTVSSNSFNDSSEENNNSKNFEVITNNSNSPVKSLFVPTEITPKVDSISKHTKSDFNLEKSLIKELHFPFATSNNHIGELAKFYRDCYNAPKLHDWDEDEEDLEGHLVTRNKNQNKNSPTATAAATESANSEVDPLTKQLQDFEIRFDDYDKLLSSLASSTTSA